MSSRSRELIEKFEQIRKLQAKQRKLERQALDQADELDDVLAVSRRVHNGEEDEVPLASASRLMGPGGDARRSAVDPEAAYSANLKAARFASPEAFARTRSHGGPPPAARGVAQALSAVGEPPASPASPATARPLLTDGRAAEEPTRVMRRAALAPSTASQAPAPAPAPVTATAPPPAPMSSEEVTDTNFRYRGAQEMDELIARFAADVEVKMGQGRENTFLRKMSELEKRERTRTIVRPKRDK